MKLLTTNFKLEKQNGITYLVSGLALAPHTIGGHSVCEDSTAGCRSNCVLWFTGRTVTQPVRQAMIARKEFLFSDPVGFEKQLCKEIELHIRRAEKGKLIPALRLNVASDLDWSHIYKRYPMVKGYDYSKVRSRLTLGLDNYEVTYSYSEKAKESECDAFLRAGNNVAVVYDTPYNGQHKVYGKLPDSWVFNKKEYKVVDGDIHDVRLRELDGTGVIVGLRFKGSLARKEQAIKKGFCVKV